MSTAAIPEPAVEAPVQAATDAQPTTPSAIDHTARSGRSGRHGARRVRRAVAAVALAATAATAALGGAGSAGALNGVGLHAAHSWLNVGVADGSTAPGARLVQWTYTGGSEQLWNVPDRRTTGEIRNVRSGLCVTTDRVPGHWLYQDRCTGRAEQQWTSLFVGSLGVEPSVQYRNPSTGLAWDVQGYSYDRGANIVGWYRKSSNWDQYNQLFTEV